MFSILFVMDEFIRYLWLVIVRTMDFLRTNSCVVVQGIEEGTFIKYYKISQLIHTQSIAN